MAPRASTKASGPEISMNTDFFGDLSARKTKVIVRRSAQGRMVSAPNSRGTTGSRRFAAMDSLRR
ncbi:MAG: hypothetical protein ABFD98_13135 [Syntrophobacteraceae bacterium]